MKKNKTLPLIIIVIIVILVILFFFLKNKSNQNIDSPTNLNDTAKYNSTTSSYKIENLNYTLPNDYYILTDTPNSKSYSGNNFVYISINTSSLDSDSVLDFLKKNDFPEEEIKTKKINNTTWYTVSYREFGSRYRYYTANYNGILYEIKIWQDESDNLELLEKDEKIILNSLKFK